MAVALQLRSPSRGSRRCCQHRSWCCLAMRTPRMHAIIDIVPSYQKSHRGQLINRRMAWAMRWVVRSPSVRLTDQKAGLPLLKPRNQV